MRRSIICCWYLALCFSLSFLLNGATVQAGDMLRPGYCEFFSDAARLPFAADDFPALSETYVAASSATAAKPKTAAWQMVYVPVSTRTWKFEYQPAAKPAPQPVSQPAANRVYLFAFWHKGQIQFRTSVFRTSTLRTIPVRSQRKHTAPVLFWGSDSVADMSLVLHLISMEVHSMAKTYITPIEQIPHRMARMFEDCFRVVY